MTDSSGFSIDSPDTFRGAVLLLLAGLAITGYGAYDYVQQTEAVRNSVEVDATITEVGVETQSSVSGQSGGKVHYEPTVEFEYEYGGSTYTGTNIFPATIAPEYDTRSAAESLVDEYESGAAVTAYVDASNPRHAFLKNKTSNEPLVAAGIGGVISLLGAASTLKKYRTA
jgi:hypothetical protein